MDSARLAFEAYGSPAAELALLDRSNYAPVIEMFIKAWSQRVGEKAGYGYGEEFRYETVVDVYRGKS